MLTVGMILIFLLICSTNASASSILAEKKNIFNDVPKSSPFYEAIYWAVDHGITVGTSPTTFSPNTTCKRKHIIVFLWRSCGKATNSSWTYPYTADQSLSATSDFGKAATWAFWRSPRIEQGIFRSGDPNQLVFEPERYCTRGEAVIYLWRLAGCPVTNVIKASQFKDVKVNDKSTDSYLRELPSAVAWAVENGITNGTSDNTFSPEKTCTRGQIVTFLYRFSQTTDGSSLMSSGI